MIQGTEKREGKGAIRKKAILGADGWESDSEYNEGSQLKQKEAWVYLSGFNQEKGK